MLKNTQLDGRYVKASVKGSRIHHSFIPRKSELQMRIISADLTHPIKVPLPKANAKISSDFSLGMYYACIYDRSWDIGIIFEIFVEFDEMYVKFMKREGRGFTWPKRDYKCWIPVFNCLGHKVPLNVQRQWIRTYIISDDEFEKFSSKKK